MPVPNEFPTTSNPSYRLAIIGEAPGESEVDEQRPFVGVSGRMLWGVSSPIGISRTDCYVGNVCQQRPFKNEISNFHWNGDEIQHGLKELKRELEEYKPNCILLLGTTPLRAAGVEHPVTDYRGTIFLCSDVTSPFYNFKCVASLHPAYVLRQYSEMPLFEFDLRRAFTESRSAVHSPPIRTYFVELTANEIISRLESITTNDLVSIDIEGGVTQGITCVGVATRVDEVFIINILDFAESEQLRIVKALHGVLFSTEIPKVLQNSLYDNFVLAWKWKMPIRNVLHDTMLSGWEIFPELPKGLGTQTSIYTREPYYKFQRKIDDKLTHYRYCCTDAAVTLEICQKHIQILNANPKAKAHYRFNMELLPAMQYMELRGIKYQKEKASERLRTVNEEMSELQKDYNEEARLLSQDKELLINPNCNNGKNSLKNILYQKLGFEPQYKKEHGRKTTTTTADVEALLQLAKSTSSDIIRNILRWRVLEGQRKQLEIGTDEDGRIRCSYNVVGTETGRLSCYESPTGNGTNLQTIMEKNRDLYIADEDHYMFQCDLSGADSWTVAAWCTKLGDSTMYDDMLTGVKPARVIAAMHKLGHTIGGLTTPELILAIKSADIPKPLYNVCKMILHGSNYGMGKNTMSSNILKTFWKKEGVVNYVSPKECEALQGLYLRGRYKAIAKWHERVKRELERSRSLDCASGHVRHFFGRPNDLETFKAALSHEPQANTTYATNLALHKLWHDPTNRTSTGRFIIEPLHQVHDALIGQFPKDKLNWAIEKIRSYFANSLTIADQPITIPFEGNYGLSWGELETPI